VNDPFSVTARTPAVTLRGVTKRFPGVVANDGVDLEISAGEVHALLGENGAGKSTLSNIITGLYRPDEGTLALHGEPVELRSPRDALARGVVEHQTAIDRAIRAHLAANWRLDRLDATARAILRCAVFELTERRDAPGEVVMDEYVEIAKSFFSGTEPGFINGVLDAIARDASAA